MFLKNKGHVMINSDLNAKTSNLDDTIMPDKYDEQFDITINEPPPKRNSQDNTTNARGNELLDMCKSLDLNIINGRKTGDLFGNYTCIKWNGNSVVDYLLTSASLFQKISVFKVGDFIPWLSDHCSIHFTLELHNNIEKETPDPPKGVPPKQFVWSETGKQKNSNMIKSTEFKNKLDEGLQLDTHPKNFVNYISEVLIEAAEKAKIKTRTEKGHEAPPWFDKPCKKLKDDIKTLRQDFIKQKKNIYTRFFF